MSRRDSSARSGRSGSRDSQRSDRSSERTSLLPGLNPRHAALFRAMQEAEGQGPSEGPSAPLQRPTSSSFPRPSGLFHVPDVRMPQLHRPATPVSATSSGGGSTVPSDPPPALYFPALLPAIPDTTPEGVPIPEQPPRLLTPAEAYVYVPFVGMTLRRARVSPKTKEVSSTATSAAGNKNNV